MQAHNKESKSDRDKTVDALYGLLSIGIVYLHSGYAGGFSIFEFGTGIKVLKQFSSLILLTFVPMFFIMYGYLSYNSFFSDEPNYSYVKRKVSHFLPLYISFLIISILTNISFWKNLSVYKIIAGFLGLYYESGITSGQIVFVANMCVLTRVVFRLFRLKSNFLIIYLVISALISDLTDRPATFYIYKYFGYYSAVIFGMTLRKITVFSKNIKDHIGIISVMTIISLAVPVMNLKKIYILEINYEPNSIEQIIFSATFLIYSYFGLKYLFHKFPAFLRNCLVKIGENSYAHFIIHIQVISFICYAGIIFSISKILIQLIIIGSASYISIYIVYPVWKRLYNSLCYAISNFKEYAISTRT